MTPLRSLGSLLALALLIGNAGTAAAQEEEAPASPSSEDARRLFEEGMEAYEEGDFERALERFERSNEIVNSSELLFNIARTAEQIGRHQQALDSYLLFLEIEPEAENRRWVERRIAFLESQIEADAPADSQPDESPLEEPVPVEESGPAPTPPVREPPDPTAAIALAAAGGAVAVTGAVLLSVGLVERAEVEGLEVVTPWPEVRDRADRAPVFMGVGGALLGVGAVAIGVSVVLLLTSEDDDQLALGADGVGARF